MLRFFAPTLPTSSVIVSSTSVSGTLCAHTCAARSTFMSFGPPAAGLGRRASHQSSSNCRWVDLPLIP